MRRGVERADGRRTLRPSLRRRNPRPGVPTLSPHAKSPASPDEPELAAGEAAGLGTGGHSRWMTAALAGGLLVLAFVVSRSDLAQLRATIRGLNPSLLLLPALATLGSYLAMARSYQGIAAAAGHPLSFGDMLRITVVANSANYLLATGGLSGFALRMYLFMRRGIPAGSAVLVSLVQTVLTNLTLLAFVGVGFVLLLTSHNLVGRELLAASALLGGFALVVIGATALLFGRRLRRRTLLTVTALVEGGLRRFLPGRTPQRLQLLRFQRNLSRGLDFLLARPREMMMPTAYILLDWILTLLVLSTAFIAIGHPVRASYVIAAFAIGMFFSIVSLVPGGLGILEGSMAATFVSLGVPLEHAVVATVIFRVAYYGLPLVASALLLRPTLRTVN
jgi:uncharacterized protein (TIRG00374 family)